jgi:ribonuclease HII
MGQEDRRYTLIDYIDRGDDHGAEMVLEKLKLLFKKYHRDMAEGYSSDAHVAIHDIEELLFKKEERRLWPRYD